MKKIIIILILLISSVFVNAQSVLFRATEVAMKEIGEEWSKWYEVEGSLKILVKDDNVYINSEATQQFKAIHHYPEYNDKDSQIISWLCLDIDGRKCTLKFRRQKNNNQLQLYIVYSDFEYVYNMTPISM